MAKYRITTLLTSVKKHYVTYEVDAKTKKEAKQKFHDAIETDREFFDEYEKEKIVDVDEL